MKKSILVVLVLSLMINIAVFATGSNNAISAVIGDNIKIFLGGKLFQPIEDDGKEIKPIIYNNRTYLPVRAIAEKSNLDVVWDASTSSINLNRNKPDIYEWFGGDARFLMQGDNVLNVGETGRIHLHYRGEYSWECSISDPKLIELTRKGVVAGELIARYPKPGAPGDAIWDFERIKEGSCDITLTCRREQVTSFTPSGPILSGERSILEVRKYHIK